MKKDKPVVVCSNLKRVFLDGPIEVEVLRDVSFKIAKAEMISIIGPSGSGKTTLLNILACLDKPTSGKVYIDGVDVTQLDDDDLSKIRREKIGMIFQDFYLLPILTILENIEVPMIFDNVPEGERKKRAMEVLTLIGLSDRAYYKPGNLSGGEQQKVAIARALVNDPAIILADEPTGNLDTVSGGKIVELLKSLTNDQGKSVLLATHDLEAAKQADRVLQLRAGVIRELKRSELP